MDQILLIIGLFIFSGIAYAQTADDNSSVTKTAWFWALLGICLALLLSVPCTLIIIVHFCYHKKDSDDSDESSTNSQSSSSSSSLTPVQRRSMHHRQHSHFAGAFRSPPPPYTIGVQPNNALVASSIPPAYETHVIEDNSRSNLLNSRTTVIQVEPAESTVTHSSTNPRSEGTIDVSSSITGTSIQTFQV